MYLLAKVPLVGTLQLVVFLVAEKGMVPAVSVFLERKEKILPELEIPGEEKVLLFSGALLVLWCSWHPFSSVDWTRGASALLLLVFVDAPVC